MSWIIIIIIIIIITKLLRKCRWELSTTTLTSHHIVTSQKQQVTPAVRESPVTGDALGASPADDVRSAIALTPVRVAGETGRPLGIAVAFEGAFVKVDDHRIHAFLAHFSHPLTENDEWRAWRRWRWWWWLSVSTNVGIVSVQKLTHSSMWRRRTEWQTLSKCRLLRVPSECCRWSRCKARWSRNPGSKSTDGINSAFSVEPIKSFDSSSNSRPITAGCLRIKYPYQPKGLWATEGDPDVRVVEVHRFHSPFKIDDRGATVDVGAVVCPERSYECDI